MRRRGEMKQKFKTLIAFAVIMCLAMMMTAGASNNSFNSFNQKKSAAVNPTLKDFIMNPVKRQDFGNIGQLAYFAYFRPQLIIRRKRITRFIPDVIIY